MPLKRARGRRAKKADGRSVRGTSSASVRGVVMETELRQASFWLAFVWDSAADLRYSHVAREVQDRKAHLGRM